MSKAKEIAEERLAKGEISEDEYDRIVGKLSNATTDSPDVDSSEDATGSAASTKITLEEARSALEEGAKPNKDFAGWLIILGIVGIVFIGIVVNSENFGNLNELGILLAIASLISLTVGLVQYFK